jgi:lipopolysaccharide export system permease protein
MFFTRLDRLVLVEWLRMLVLTLSLLVGLFLVADMQNRLIDLISYGASVGEILKYYVIVVPTFFPIVLPLSVLISSLVALSSMHRRLEIVAMRNAGLSVTRITRFCWVATLLLAGLLFWLNGHFVPWAKENSKELWNSYRFEGEKAKAKSAEEIGQIPNLTFNNPKDRRRWFINRFSEYDYNAYGLTVSTFDEKGTEISRVLANRGYYDDLNGYWILLNGREMTFDPVEGDALRNIGFERREFPEMHEDPTLMQYLKKRPQDLSVWQLQRVRNALEEANDPTARKYLIRYLRILMNPFDVLIALGLAVPFAIGPMRANPLVGIVKAIGLYVGYYASTQAIAALLPADLSAVSVVAVPTVLMFIGTLVLFSRTGHPAK